VKVQCSARPAPVCSQFRRVPWAIDPVVVSSITQCFILIGFSALSHSVADLTGVRCFYCAAISASRSLIYGFLFLALHQGHGRLLYLRLHPKDGPPKTLAQWLGATTVQETCPATSRTLRLSGCSAPRSIQRPTQLALPPLLLHLTPSASATSPLHLANFLSSRCGSLTCDAPPSGLRDS
jgi:hypothetical protein